MDRRRFLGGAALLGASAALGPAGVIAVRRAAAPGSPDVTHSGQGAPAHAPRPALSAPEYVTLVETHRTPLGVPYLAAVAVPVSDRTDA
jgi:hypothetical protein